MSAGQRSLPFLFIGGHRKCGTTMFFNLFDGHPELRAYPTDLNLLYAYFPVYLDSRWTPPQRRARLKRILFDELRAEDRPGLDVDAMEQLFFAELEDADLVEMGTLVRRLLQSFAAVTPAASSAPALSVVKETSCEIYAASLFEWFPDMKFIHLIRDPRDNYAALKSGVESYYSALGEGNGETLASLIHRSLIGMRSAPVNQQRFGSDRYLILRFEDVVTAPRDSMERVCAFLGIRFDESLLVPTRAGARDRGNSFDGTAFEGVSARNADRWRERISEQEAQVIEFHFASEMTRFGYDLEFSDVARLDAVSDFYKWSNYRYFFSDRFAQPAVARATGPGGMK